MCAQMLPASERILAKCDRCGYRRQPYEDYWEIFDISPCHCTVCLHCRDEIYSQCRVNGRISYNCPKCDQRWIIPIKPKPTPDPIEEERARQQRLRIIAKENRENVKKYDRQRLEKIAIKKEKKMIDID